MSSHLAAMANDETRSHAQPESSLQKQQGSRYPRSDVAM
jgi:hypothetical protein